MAPLPAGIAAPRPDEPVSLLLVEDDPDLAGLLTRVLGGEGYAVTHAADGQQGLHQALTHFFAVLVVDRGLPAVEGLELIAVLRSRGVRSPMLVLSARASTQDRVDGLDAGAEDYLAKPFDIGELLARLRALLRRHDDAAHVLAVPGGALERAERVVHLTDGGWVQLSDRECALLSVLALRPRQAFSRDALLARVFAGAESPNVVDTYVHYCRQKLGRGVISTVRGVGYRLGSR